MSFFKDLKKNLDNPSLNSNESDSIPDDQFNFIELNGSLVSIYDIKVSSVDILSFFQSLVPWVRLSVKDLSDPQDFSETYSPSQNEIKTELYNELVFFLEKEFSHYHDEYRSLSDGSGEPISNSGTKH